MSRENDSYGYQSVDWGTFVYELGVDFCCATSYSVHGSRVSSMGQDLC